MRYFILLSAVLVILLNTSVTGQTTGTIAGTVNDARDGEPLIGVNIIIRGTSFGTASDMDGNYEIRNIRAGEYSIEVSYLGYERQLITGIRVCSRRNHATQYPSERADTLRRSGSGGNW
jgi:hypothetical protein